MTTLQIYGLAAPLLLAGFGLGILFLTRGDHRHGIKRRSAKIQPAE